MTVSNRRAGALVSALSLSALLGLAGIGCVPFDEDEVSPSSCEVRADATIESDTTLGADGPGCYRLPSGLHVRNDALLTIEPGVTLFFEEGTRFSVRNARLDATGESDAEIRMTGVQEVPGHWNGLAFNRSNSSDNTLAHVVIEYGGGAPYSTGVEDVEKANLQLNGHGDNEDVRISVTNSTFSNSDGYGIAVLPPITFEACEGNEFANNASGKSDEDSSCP